MIHQIYKTQPNVEFSCDALIRGHPSSRKIISTQLVEKMLAIRSLLHALGEISERSERLGK